MDYAWRYINYGGWTVLNSYNLRFTKDDLRLRNGDYKTKRLHGYTTARLHDCTAKRLHDCATVRHAKFKRV